MNDDADRRFLEDVRTTLTEAERNLDGATLSRLRRARQAALAGRPARIRSRVIRWGMVPVTSMAVVALLLFSRYHGTSTLATQEPDDWQILTAEEPLDMYQEDMGFYEWLSEESEIMEKEDVRRNGRLPADDAGGSRLTGPPEGADAVAAAGGHRILGCI